MNKLIYIIASVILLFGCTQKPAPPRRSGSHATTSQSSVGRIRHDAKPPLPNRNTAQTGRKSNINNQELSPTEIFATLSSAVFKIHTSTGLMEFQGSGFFISDNGVAVSNYHVFKGTTTGQEAIILSDGSQYKLTNVYYKSEENDFIIFQVGMPNKVNYIRIANVTPKVGEKIYTIGSPRGLDNTFSSGEISQIRGGGNVLQISAPIDHGSSGGVLLNSKGEAVGITYGGLDESGANLNFAININLIKPYIP